MQDHKGHPKRIVPLPRSSENKNPHYGKVECRLCKTFVRWASQNEVNDITNGEVKWQTI